MKPRRMASLPVWLASMGIEMYFVKTKRVFRSNGVDGYVVMRTSDSTVFGFVVSALLRWEDEYASEHEKGPMNQQTLGSNNTKPITLGINRGA